MALTSAMSVETQAEQATIEEAAAILLERMPPSKVAQLLSAWRAGQGDYLSLREKLFRGETVDSLFKKARNGKHRR
jgi:hypothetical protein